MVINSFRTIFCIFLFISSQGNVIFAVWTNFHIQFSSNILTNWNCPWGIAWWIFERLHMRTYHGKMNLHIVMQAVVDGSLIRERERGGGILGSPSKLRMQMWPLVEGVWIKKRLLHNIYKSWWFENFGTILNFLVQVLEISNYLANRFPVFILNKLDAFNYSSCTSC